MTQEYLQQVIDEFCELRSRIEAYKYYELDNLYFKLDEFEDDWCELSVTDKSMPDAIIQMVYVDRNEDDTCTVCLDHVTIRIEGSHLNEAISVRPYLSMIDKV